MSSASSKRSRVIAIVAYSALFLSVIQYIPALVDSLNFPNWSRADWFLFIQTLVFIASALIAFFTINSSKATAKERATLDIIVEDYRDTNLFEAKTHIYEFIDDPQAFIKNNLGVTKTSLVQICEAQDSSLHDHEKKLKQSLMLVLNRNEFYASGINSGLLDEKLFKRVHCSNIIKLWGRLSPTVTQIRKNAQVDTLFKDLELMATRWKANPLKADDLK